MNKLQKNIEVLISYWIKENFILMERRHFSLSKVRCESVYVKITPIGKSSRYTYFIIVYISDLNLSPK